MWRITLPILFRWDKMAFFSMCTWGFGCGWLGPFFNPSYERGGKKTLGQTFILGQFEMLGCTIENC